ncbi:MAG TPA: cytochrome c biogenesis protein CcdA [Puia sp.]|nr:cytochrome c biogenesis protein CcdA [Puia sp.]
MRFHRHILGLLSPPNLLLAVVCVFILSQQRAFAQQVDTAQQAVSWEFKAQPGSNGNPLLVLHARIRDGWKLYSTTNPDTLGYSRVSLDSSAHVKIESIEEKGALQRKKDPIFNGSETSFFTGDVDFLVQLGSSTPDELRGAVTFIAARNDSVVGPTDVPFRFGHDPDGGWIAKSTTLQQSAGEAGSLKKTSIDLANPVNTCGGTGAESSKGFIAVFLLGMLGGLIALIMPCTFPMIPLTVSFFTKQSGSRRKAIGNASLYGFFIFAIYVLISVPFYFLKSNSANILNDISTNVWLNISFATIFIVFALSFFGVFEITLPSRFSNSTDSKSSLGTIGGIFFMALTLAIVSFSCTGPILGTLLVEALGQSGGAVQLTIAMAGFGLMMGLPFALFALFPNWLQSLPKSGSWMNTVKITFGFIELAFALKYFSNADLAYHWGLLKRETFFGLWILIDFALVLYLLGVIKFHHDPPPPRLSKGRKIIALVFLVFGLYLLPGLTDTSYAKLSLLSGIVPPWEYTIYGNRDQRLINDYEAAIRLARQEHKPILIDFTGWACANCRRMEENVWTKPEVRKLLNNDYVLVSLYVDDRKQLPADQQFSFSTSDGSIKEIHTIGDKFATLQSENFKSASQPLYVVISPDEKLLTKPVPYTPNPGVYAQWLQCGLDAFHREN